MKKTMINPFTLFAGASLRPALILTMLWGLLHPQFIAAQEKVVQFSGTFEDLVIPDERAGGGGGYTGGAAGDNGEAGKGGYSYVTTSLKTISPISWTRGNPTDSQNGFIRYEFRDRLPTYTIHLAKDPTKCIDDKDAQISNRTNIQLKNCDGAAAQAWYRDGAYLRLFQDPGKCLTVAGLDADPGRNIYLWDCKDGEGKQQFEAY